MPKVYLNERDREEARRERRRKNMEKAIRTAMVKQEVRSVSELAGILGMNRVSLGRYINGEAKMPAEVLMDICDALRVPTAERGKMLGG